MSAFNELSTYMETTQAIVPRREANNRGLVRVGSSALEDQMVVLREEENAKKKYEDEMREIAERQDASKARNFHPVSPILKDITTVCVHCREQGEKIERSGVAANAYLACNRPKCAAWYQEHIRIGNLSKSTDPGRFDDANAKDVVNRLGVCADILTTPHGATPSQFFQYYYKHRHAKEETELTELKRQVKELQADLDNCRQAHAELQMSFNVGEQQFYQLSNSFEQGKRQYEELLEAWNNWNNSDPNAYDESQGDYQNQ